MLTYSDARPLVVVRTFWVQKCHTPHIVRLGSLLNGTSRLMLSIIVKTFIFGSANPPFTPTVSDQVNYRFSLPCRMLIKGFSASPVRFWNQCYPFRTSLQSSKLPPPIFQWRDLTA
jgi:hypothetical protein